MKNQYKSILVISGAIIFSTLAIQASDFVRKIDGGISKLLTSSVVDSLCEQGTVLLHTERGSVCVDVFEASAGENCPITVPASPLHTQENLNIEACSAVSKQGVIPWTSVSLVQAQQLCARSNKRLLTPQEWYSISLSQSDQSDCVLDASARQVTGSRACKTGAGVFDMVGNVWEWVDGQVLDGTYNGHDLPDSGFVSLVDSQGVVLQTSTEGTPEYGHDYAMTGSIGVYGIIRGGFYNSGDDGGIFAQNLAVPLDLKTDGIGFRCVRDI
jgi:hypothetical protein